MKETLARRAYESLRERLVSGELAPGTRLVNRTLARDLGISFTPVREAINQLASEGLVEYVRGGGAYVRRVNRRELAQLYDLREALEPFAAAEAARHITAHELEELDEICADWHELARRIRATAKEPGGGQAEVQARAELARRWALNEERFHRIVIEAARNCWLEKIGGDLLIVSQAFAPLRQHPTLLTLGAAAITWKSHASLVKTLRRRDVEGARAWMTEHIRAGRRYVLEILREQRASDLDRTEGGAPADRDHDMPATRSPSSRREDSKSSL